jgi:hypothetical protein
MKKDLWALSLKCIACKTNCKDNTDFIFAKNIQLESISTRCQHMTFKDMNTISDITSNKKMVNDEFGWYTSRR